MGDWERRWRGKWSSDLVVLMDWLVVLDKLVAGLGLSFVGIYRDGKVWHGDSSRRHMESA